MPTSHQKSVLAVVLTVLLGAVTLTYTYRDTLGLAEPPTAEQVENVRAFAKLYGYVRYFHPSDAAAETDWDTFAVHGVRQVKDASSPTELRERLETLFEPIAPTIQLYRADDTPPPPADVLTPPDTSGLQLVAWQHRGLGLQSDWPYYSTRLNRPTGSSSQDATDGDTSWSRPKGFPYAQASQRLDVGQFQGKQVRLRASVRTADAESQGRLYLYVAGPGEQNAPAGDPVASQSWSTTERTVSVPASADRLWIGVSVRAPGTAWFDNIELLVRDAPGDSWEHSRLANSGFESGERGNSLPGWRFSKDPGSRESSVAGNAYEGQWSLKLSVPPPSELRLFEAHPSIGEVAQKQIGRGISVRIPLALYSREGQTLRPDGAPTPGDLQARLDSLEIPHSDPDFFLANVVVAWNVFQHFYPYFNVVDVNWDQVLTQSLRRALADRSETEFQRTLQRMVARLQDGHGRVTPSPTSPSNWPFRLARAGETVIVADDFSPAAADGNICPEPGDVVISVGGAPIKTKLREAKRYISGSPQYTDAQALEDFGRLTDQPSTSLILRRNGHRVECKVHRHSGIPPMQAEPRPDPIATLEGGIRYVDLTRVPWGRVHKTIEAVAQAPGVIFEMRGYPETGNLLVVSHLSRDTLPAPPFQTPQIIYPDQDSLVGYNTDRSTRSPFAPALPHIDGPVVFLTDARAISAAEMMMSMVKHYDLATVVGPADCGDERGCQLDRPCRQLPGSLDRSARPQARRLAAPPRRHRAGRAGRADARGRALGQG